MVSILRNMRTSREHAVAPFYLQAKLTENCKQSLRVRSWKA